MYDESVVAALNLQELEMENQILAFKMVEPQTVSQKLFQKTVFENVQFIGTEFEGCHFYQVRFENCGLSGVVFKNCTFVECQWNATSGSPIEVHGGTFVLRGQTDWVENEQVHVDWNFHQVLILTQTERARLPEGQVKEVWYRSLGDKPSAQAPSPIMPPPAAYPTAVPSSSQSAPLSDLKGRFSELEKDV